MSWPPTAKSLAAHAPRYRDVPWVGVAAAPDSGEPRVDDLVAAVSRRARRHRSCATKQVAGVGISIADRRRPVRPRRRRRGPASAGGGAARAAQRDPAAATAVQVRAHDRAAQPDPAGPGAAVVLRPQPLRLGALRAAGGRREPDPAPSCRRSSPTRGGAPQRGGRRGGRRHHHALGRRRAEPGPDGRSAGTGRAARRSTCRRRS